MGHSSRLLRAALAERGQGRTQACFGFGARALIEQSRGGRRDLGQRIVLTKRGLAAQANAASGIRELRADAPESAPRFGH